MSLQLLKCPNCGAPLPTAPAGGVLVCAFCRRGTVIPGAVTPGAAAAPVPATAPLEASAPPPGPPEPAPPASSTPAEPGSRLASRRSAAGANLPTPPARPSRLAGSRVTGAGTGDPPPAPPPNTARSEDAVLSLARRHLQLKDSLYYAPNVPPDKEKNARKAHEVHLPRDERVLVLYDDTLFGAADDGFVITARRLCWKNLMEEPRMVAWPDLERGSVRFDKDSLEVMGSNISITGEDAEKLFSALGRLLQELAG